jgi:hypothetical protein
MKIILEENDSFIQQDKHAKMIIVAVTMDDGKFIRFPYSAERTFSDLIFDIDAKITCAGFGVRPNLRYENVVPSPSNASTEVRSGLSAAAEVSLSSSVAVPPVEDNQIRKEDLVRCIKVEPRAKDAPIDIAVGNIYRVLKVHGPVLTIDGKLKKIIDGFDIIDDKSETPRRIFAAPSEMEFYQKRKPAPVKVIGKFESIFLCPYCFIMMVATKEDDGKYHGKCMSCLKESTHELKPKVKDEQPTVGTGSQNDSTGAGVVIPASV